jgi:tetratricopeptide (TPR) repeat protein
LNLILTYRGHPDVLVEALKFFVESGVRPYALAGFALVLHAAAYTSNGERDPDGLNHGLQYWKRAHIIHENRFEIDFIGTWLYHALKQPEQERQILDKYREKFSQNFWYCLAESTYWTHKDEAKSQQWLKRAYQGAKNNIQRLFVLNYLAGIELDKPGFGNAVSLYSKVTELDPNDPWAWHNMSYVHFNSGRLDDAEACNKRALQIMDFGAARQIQQMIADTREANQKKQQKSGSLFGFRRDRR